MKKKQEESRGTCEGTGQATRLRKRGKKMKKKQEESRGTCEGTWRATRLRKSGKKKI